MMDHILMRKEIMLRTKRDEDKREYRIESKQERKREDVNQIDYAVK